MGNDRQRSAAVIEGAASPSAWRKTGVRLAVVLLFLAWGAASLAIDVTLDEEGDAEHGASVAAEDEAPAWDVNAPPGEWRAVPIDTNELTWSSVDVSPDGRTVVFDLLGDLYAVPIAGGDATALTSGIAWDMQPRFSPDGRQIAFVSDRAGADNLWVMDAAGGEATVVTEERQHLLHNPAWSPDGQWLAARKGYVGTRSIPAGSIWLYHRSGGDGLMVVDRPDGPQSQKNIAEPAFSPDGRFLYYSQDVTPGAVWAYNKDATGQIFVIKRLDRETGETVVVTGGPGGAILPTPSPDGKRLAFVRRLPDMTSALFLRDLDSGLERRLFAGLDRDLQETNGSQGNYPAIAWTPDGSALVAWAGGKLHRIDGSTGSAAEIPIRVRDERMVREALRFPVAVAPERFPLRAIRWVRYSPDRSQVVFQALGHLYVRDAAGGEARRLTDQQEHFEFWPAWSRDGRYIAYTSWDDEAFGAVRVVPASGGEGQVLTNRPGHYVEPAFSPDGKELVFRKFAGGFLLSPLWSGEPGIYRVGLLGGAVERVVETGTNPQFAPDGQRILFTASGEEPGQVELRSVDRAGHDERTHLKADAVTEFSVSPDGRWVAFTEQYDAWVAPFVATGQPISIGRDSSAIPVRQVSARAGEWLHWSGDSSTLHWSHGATVFSRDLDDAFAFLDGAPETLPEPATEGLNVSFEVAADRPEGAIAIIGARVVTMRAAGRFEEVIQDGVVVVRGNRIEAVGQRSLTSIPEDAFRLDAKGMTVIPGLVDAHAHGSMASSEITPEQNWGQFSNLSFGLTTIHDPSNDSSEIFSHAELQRTGQVLGPRTYSTGTILYGANFPGYTAVVDSYDDALFHVRRLKDLGAISVKSYNQLRRDSRQQVIAAGAEEGIMVVPEGGAKIQHNLTHIIDGHTGLEHAIPIARGYDDLTQLWTATAVGYTPTFGVAYGGLSGETYWYDRTRVWENERLLRFVPKALVYPAALRRTTAPDSHYNHIAVARYAKALRDRGVSVQVGAHGQREGLAVHWELWMMEQGGFTPWEALRAGTIDGARYLGLDRDLGSLEVGKLADLVVIDGNVLADLRQSERVRWTMLNGRLYEAATMNQIAPEPRERQPFFFEREGGDVFSGTGLATWEAKARAYHWRH